MPLNMQDQYLESERQPPALVALGDRLKRAYGVGADNFGIKGNEYHNDGYHRSRNFLLYSPQGNGGDYSTSGSLNQGGDPNNNAAFDFTPGSWGTSDNRAKMIELTKRLRAAARASDRRLDAYYEFAGTEDGVHVVTFYAQGGEAKTPFDSSHLDHIHGSKYRSRADNDDAGLGDIMLGIVDAGEEDEHMSMGAIPLGYKETNISVPGGASGGGSRQKWMAVCNETEMGQDGKRPPYALRVYATTGDNAWSAVFRDSNGNLTALPKFTSGKVSGYPLPIGVRAIKVTRAPIGPDGRVYDPEGTGEVPADAVVYSGSLSCSVEG
jgi:hypothetical protein